MNDQTARERIMARLRAAGTERMTVSETALPPTETLDQDAKLDRLTALMSAMRTEIHIVEADAWVDKLKALAREKGWKRVLYGPGAPVGDHLAATWASDAEEGIELVAYNQPVETFKQDLFFNTDAGVTGTRGGVADTGAVVLWPTSAEPRLMSLVPPVHVAVLDVDRLYASLGEMMAAENWAEGMPTNALLVSGPSKTADIEFTLVFGVHGPKELILLIRK